MNYTVGFDFLITLGFIYMFVFLNEKLGEDNITTKKRTKKANLDRTCREYLQTLKGNIHTSKYGAFIAFVCGFVMFIILQLLKYSINITKPQIYLATFLTVGMVFGISYKFIGCMVSRTICIDDCNLFNSNI